LDSDLEKIRTEKEISLNEISSELNIPEKFLLAIEELNFEELPAPIFAKSQIRKYYSFFNLDPLTILDKYEEFLRVKNVPHVDENLESSQSFFSIFMPILLRKKITLLSVIIFFLIIFAYLIFGFDDQKKDTNYLESISEDQEILNNEMVIDSFIRKNEIIPSNVIDDQIAFDADTDVPTIEIDYEDDDENNVSEIEIIVQGESWVEIIDDEQILLFELLQTGLYEVAGYGPFKFKIGHSPSVKIYLNGKNIDFSKTVSQYTDYAHFLYEDGVVVELFTD
jgi:hypothetical protein